MKNPLGRVRPSINLFFYLSCAAVFTASTAVGCARATPATETPPVVKIVKPMPTLALSQEFERVKQLSCLSEAIYAEGRSESALGRRMIAETVLNRVDSKRWPNSVCEVIYQKSQFSYTEDHNLDKARRAFSDSKPSAEVLDAIRIAMEAMKRPRRERVAADHYHAKSVSPFWASKYREVGVVENHVFYASR